MPASTKKPVIAITVGDFNGIGPEVALKSLRSPAVRKACTPVLIGPAEAFEFYAKRLGLPLRLSPFVASDVGKKGRTLFIESEVLPRYAIKPGVTSARAGKVAANALRSAVQAVQAGLADAIVTAPVSKKAMHKAGVDFPGQTEMVQHLSGSQRVAMMLVAKTMRVGLATIHIPIRDVPAVLTRALLSSTIDNVSKALTQDWNIRSPRLAVLGLNPHASEEGDIGREDIDIVSPTVKRFRRKGMKIEGPFPADAFFGKYKPGMFDAIIAMYHDQGLIPLKMSSFGKGVNVSVGLNLVRTSPDHGTAFDIAGKGTANPSSMIEAIVLATQTVHHRRSRGEHR